LPAGAQALPAAYQFALKDTTYIARAASIEAFSKYGISVSRSLLDAALADKDWAVRVRAAQLLKQADPASDADARIRPAPTRLAPEIIRRPPSRIRPCHCRRLSIPIAAPFSWSWPSSMRRSRSITS